MRKQGRTVDKALMRTSVNKKLQTFSHKRLAKDLQEIEQEKIPTVGVTARPLQRDLFVWHANIRGPQGTLYEGGVFHLQMKFPQSYPHHPPTVKLYNNIPHPNVFDTYICLDMIQQTTNIQREQGAGWSSAYSVQSVLTQLQSFLFQENLEKDKIKVQMEIKKAVKEANSFKCPCCKHGGKLSCWPLFSTKEQSLEEFVTIDEEKELIRKQLICFHTKLTYKDNQMGLGVKISKIPRTGNIREAQTYFDYISLKAFIKESMNFTSSNERITHWLPVYFGIGDNQQRFLHCMKKAISMIMTGSTKNFKSDFILEVFPKLIITMVYHIMDQKKHPSIRIIRILTHIHSMFLFLVKKFPELGKQIESSIIKFIKDEQLRTKQFQANLGCILAMMTVVDEPKFSQIVQPYFQEQLDRQVLWILKSVPELLDEKMVQEADKLRTQIVFKSQMTSFQILCFYKLFITQVCESRKSKLQLLEQYNANLFKLSNKEQNHLQASILRMQKQVISFDVFFKYTGLKSISEEETKALLKQSIKNSERKKYHGQFEVIHEMPKSDEQFKKLMQKVPTYQQYIEVTTQKQGEKGVNNYKIVQKPSKDEDWRKMCINRWAWIRETMSCDSTLDAKQISYRALEYARQGNITKKQDRIMKIIDNRYRNREIQYKEPSVSIPDTDWKRLFLRLDLEDFLLYIDMNPDFPQLYQKLEVCRQNNLNTILIPMLSIKNIKSGYFYITTVLSKLTSLKYLQFSGVRQQNNQLLEKAAKSIRKGFTNFFEAKGRFDVITFHNIQVQRDYSDCFFNYLKDVDSITSLRFSKTNMFHYGNTMMVLSKALANMKDVQQLSFNYCGLNQDKCKILADSLMRMKKLRIFIIHDANQLGLGLSSILYNLAFSPNLRMLDMNNVNIGSNNNQIHQIVVSMQKMLKINASIEVVKASRIVNLNQKLTKEFWVSLGECKSLRVLDLSFSGDLSTKKVQIGKSIAFNARKKCSLEYFNMTNCLSSEQSINALYTAMNISDYDEEDWYGDPNKLQKMIPSNYKKIYYNNLKALQMNLCTNLNPRFTLAHYNKLVTKKQPEYVALFASSPNLESISLRSTGLQKNFADILVLALDPRRENFKSKIKVLDLSKNNLGKDGIKALTEILPHNNIIQVLDLSKNHFGVSGAYELSVALRNNKSLKFLNIFNNKICYDGVKAIAENIIAHHTELQFLELGHNRIRDKGLKAVITSLIQNKQSKLKILGLRFNFISNLGSLDMMKMLTEHKNHLEQLFIRNNQIDDIGITYLSDLQEKHKNVMTIDLLEKVKYLEQDKSDKTIWIHPINSLPLDALRNFFEVQYECGIIIDIRLRHGRKYPNKVGENKFVFIQFADATSVNRALHLASRKLTIIHGVKFRIYKAGTGTFVYSKKTAKQKKLEIASKSLPPDPFGTNRQSPILANRMTRGGSRGGSRGRGASRGRRGRR